MFTDEQDIERTLKGALDVAPSAGFEARVERRIADDRPPRSVALPAWLAAAAAVILAAGWWFIASPVIEPPRVMQQVQSSVPAADPMELEPRVTPQEHPSPRPSQLGAARPAVSRRTAAPGPAVRQVEPEVIVPANQLEIIRRLMRGANSPLMEMAEARALMTPAPSELVVPPLVVDPIPVVALEAAGGWQGAKGLQ